MNREKVYRVKHLLIRFCKWFFGIFGLISFIFLVLSFTDIPYYAYYWLGSTNTKLSHKPDIIVLLGGNGMPSPDGLMRAYYTEEAAKEFKEAKIIIAYPYNEEDSLYQLKLMAKELILKGIDSSRIQFEPIGFNTRSQALNIASLFEKTKSKLSVLLITSPQHMYRSIKTFKKVGFVDVGGISTFEKPPNEEKIKDKENSKDIRVKNVTLRYNMWSYLNYELLVLREYFAISYYKLKGWI